MCVMNYLQNINDICTKCTYSIIMMKIIIMVLNQFINILHYNYQGYILKNNHNYIVYDIIKTLSIADEIIKFVSRNTTFVQGLFWCYFSTYDHT